MYPRFAFLVTFTERRLCHLKEKPAELVMTPELAITSELVPPLPAYSSVMMSAKRCGLASLLLSIKGLTPEIH